MGSCDQDHHCCDPVGYGCRDSNPFFKPYYNSCQRFYCCSNPETGRPLSTQKIKDILGIGFGIDHDPVGFAYHSNTYLGWGILC